jgi:hypothetical protein
MLTLCAISEREKGGARPRVPCEGSEGPCTTFKSAPSKRQKWGFGAAEMVEPLTAGYSVWTKSLGGVAARPRQIRAGKASRSVSAA